MKVNNVHLAISVGIVPENKLEDRSLRKKGISQPKGDAIRGMNKLQVDQVNKVANFCWNRSKEQVSPQVPNKKKKKKKKKKQNRMSAGNGKKGKQAAYNITRGRVFNSIGKVPVS